MAKAEAEQAKKPRGAKWYILWGLVLYVGSYLPVGIGATWLVHWGLISVDVARALAVPYAPISMLITSNSYTRDAMTELYRLVRPPKR